MSNWKPDETDIKIMDILQRQGKQRIPAQEQGSKQVETTGRPRDLPAAPEAIGGQEISC